MNALLDAALRYAEAGDRVLPLKPGGKLPLTPRGAKDATTDEQTIRGWWARWPDANVGMALDNKVVLDVDPRNEGSIDEVIEHHGALPDKCVAHTGGGGSHHLFRARPGVRYPGKLNGTPGVDVKSGANVYIVVEPSIHPSGRQYAWVDESEPWQRAPAEAPEWLGAKDEPRPADDRPRKRADWTQIRDALESIPADDRDSWFRVGAALHSEDDPLAFAVWDEWSKRSAKYDPTDQRKTWDSFKSGGIKIGTLFDMARKRGWRSSELVIQFTHLPPDALTTPPPRRRFAVFPHFPSGATSIVAASGGAGKSTWMTEIALHVALGRHWHGHETEGGDVVIVTAEDTKEDYWRRLYRLAEVYPELREHAAKLVARLHIVDWRGTGAVLVENEFGAAKVTVAGGLLAERIAEDYPEARLVVLETVSRLMAADEGNPAFVAFVSACDAVAARLPEAGVVALHHTSKDAARKGVADQYIGRGGGALNDNARSTVTLVQLDAGKEKKKLAPPGADPELLASKRLVLLRHPRSSYARPAKDVFLVASEGEGAPVLTPYEPTPGKAPKSEVERLVEFVREQEARPDHPRLTRNFLERCAGQMGLSRRAVGEALACAEANHDLTTKRVRQNGEKGQPFEVFTAGLF